MRIDSRADRWFAAAAGVIAFVAATGLGALALGDRGAFGGAVVGLWAGFALHHALGRGAARRHALMAVPFSESWRRLLRERYDHYDRLPPDLRGHFEDDVRLFVAQKRITGVGISASEELKVLVAASAVTLSVAWPDYEWDQLTEVLLYPQAFNRDYGFEDPELTGMAHHWGTVILSVPSLLEAFEDPDDGSHVGIHEFAHLLQLDPGFDQTRFGEIPPGLGPNRSRAWSDLLTAEMDRVRRGESVLDPYGGENPSEFLAVAVETFFEIPIALRDRHRELYAILAAHFRQDPAAWDEVRGL